MAIEARLTTDFGASFLVFAVFVRVYGLDWVGLTDEKSPDDASWEGQWHIRLAGLGVDG